MFLSFIRLVTDTPSTAVLLVCYYYCTAYDTVRQARYQTESRYLSGLLSGTGLQSGRNFVFHKFKLYLDGIRSIRASTEVLCSTQSQVEVHLAACIEVNTQSGW